MAALSMVLGGIRWHVLVNAFGMGFGGRMATSGGDDRDQIGYGFGGISAWRHERQHGGGALGRARPI